MAELGEPKVLAKWSPGTRRLASRQHAAHQTDGSAARTGEAPCESVTPDCTATSGVWAAGPERIQLDTPTWQHPVVLEHQHRCGGFEVGVIVDDRESVCGGKCCGQQVGYADRSMAAIRC